MASSMIQDIKSYTLPRPSLAPTPQCIRTGRAHGPNPHAPVYYCEQCDQVLCRSCSLAILDRPGSDHKVTHTLQEVLPNRVVNFTDFIQSHPSMTRRRRAPRSAEEFVMSEYAFTPSPSHSRTIELQFDTAPGSYNLSMTFYTQSHPENLVNLRAGNRPLAPGSGRYAAVSLGALVVSARDPSSRGLEQQLMEPVSFNVYQGEAQKVKKKIVCGYNLHVRSSVQIFIKADYRPGLFGKGPPFSWWPHKIVLSRCGERMQHTALELSEQFQARRQFHEIRAAKEEARNARLREEQARIEGAKLRRRLAGRTGEDVLLAKIDTRLDRSNGVERHRFRSEDISPFRRRSQW